MYQGSWIAGMAVDTIPEDMTREGVEFKSPDAPDIIEHLDAMCDKYRVWDSICSALKWSRLYGGAVAVIMIDGADISQPLTIESVRPGSFRGLFVMDRWQVEPSSEVVQEIGPFFGKPISYRPVTGCTLDTHGKSIHYSRVLRFEGQELPFYLALAYQGWGASILERIADKIKTFDLTTQGAAQLVSKAYLRNVKIKGFRAVCGLAGDEAQRGFMNQMRFISMLQSQEGLTIMDAEDDFQAHTYTFSGLPDVLLQFGQQISGALGIPLVRLFGQAPTGFNATGESDLRTYYDNIKHLQDSKLRANLAKLWKVMICSATGKLPPKTFSFDFRPLWQMTSEQRAQAAQQLSSTILQAMDSGAVGKAVAVKELRKLNQSLGVFSSITDEDIEKAEEEDNAPPPPMPGMPGIPGMPGGPGGMMPNAEDENSEEPGPQDAESQPPAGAVVPDQIEAGSRDRKSDHSEQLESSGPKRFHRPNQ